MREHALVRLRDDQVHSRLERRFPLRAPRVARQSDNALMACSHPVKLGLSNRSRRLQAVHHGHLPGDKDAVSLRSTGSAQKRAHLDIHQDTMYLSRRTVVQDLEAFLAVHCEQDL